MKKLFSIAFAINLCILAHAQCNKTVTWTASKTEYLDSGGKLQRTQAGSLTIQTNPNHITVNFKNSNGDSNVIEGNIKDLNCNWNEAFKNGKTSFSSTMVEESGDTHEAKINFEGKNGALTMIVELEDKNGMKLRVPIDAYKEQD